MKKILKYIVPVQLVVLAFALLSMGGCKNYDDPDPTPTITWGERVKIAEIKKLYTDIYDTIAQAVVINNTGYVEAMVTSSDEGGNLYRTIYIQDDTGGIEVKVGTSANYNIYKQGQIVYVLIDKLVLGNYRHNLSLGAPVAANSDYANGYIDVRYELEQRIIKGRILDIYDNDFITIPVVTSPAQLNDNLIGSLVRFEGLTSTWGTFGLNTYPSFLEQKDNLASGAVVYKDFLFTDVIQAWKQHNAGLIPEPDSPEPGHLYGPTYAFKNPKNFLNYYGTALFKFGSSTEDAADNLLMRTSGFSKFALELLPPNGAKVNVTAICNKYSDKTGKKHIVYQLVINDSKSVEIVK